MMLWVANNLRIEKITCKSQFGACNITSQAAIESIDVKSQNILETRKRLNMILAADKNIIDYSIQFKLPFGFEVFVIERKAVVAFALSDGKFSLVDKDGVILSEVTSTDLPRITSSGDLTQSELAYIARIVSRLYTLYGVRFGMVVEDSLEIDNLEGKKIIFPLGGDESELMGALSLILSRLPSMKEASTIRVIDLRYKNPVLR